jgi:murein DD-endopeptidase MepM/ murein hydrolase activator NlpD
VNRRRRSLVAVLSATLALVVALVGAASGQTEPDRQRQIGEQIEGYRSQVQEASAEEARLLGELDASVARKRELDAKVAAMDADISVVQRNLNAAQSRLAAAEAEQRGAELRLADAQHQLAEARARLAAYAVAAYTGQSDATRYVEATLRSRSMGELVAKRSYMKAVGNTQAETVALDERLRDEVKDLRDELDEARQEAQVQRNTVQTERTRLQESRDAQDAVRNEVAVEVARTEELRGQVVARKAEFEAEIEELEQESAAIEATLRRRAEDARAAAAAAAAAPSPSASPGSVDEPSAAADAPAPPAASSGGGGLITPIPGAPVTSGFGLRVHPIYGDARMHTGVDMGAGSGTPIRAAGSGTVVSAEWFGGYGNATIIEHGDGLATLYAHQSAMLVGAGTRVSQGQVIGRVGCTGSCTGPHLHFEVRVDGTPVNPLNYI